MSKATFEPGPISPVDCQRADDRWTLVLVRDLAHPPERVWAALTQPDQLTKWSPYTSDRDLSSTGDAVLTMIAADGAGEQEIPVQVNRVEPPTLLEHTWGTDLLRWELTPTSAGTRLVLHHTVSEQELMPKMAAGWHLCLVVAEHLLDGQPIAPIRADDAKNYGWVELRDAYAKELGIAD
jgi:uncharacterized protein YndB with AHSA1/START domain